MGYNLPARQCLARAGRGGDLPQRADADILMKLTRKADSGTSSVRTMGEGAAGVRSLRSLVADDWHCGVRWQSVAPTPLSECSAGGCEVHRKPVILSQGHCHFKC